jgi:hypothetical protein
MTMNQTPRFLLGGLLAPVWLEGDSEGPSVRQVPHTGEGTWDLATNGR